MRRHALAASLSTIALLSLTACGSEDAKEASPKAETSTGAGSPTKAGNPTKADSSAPKTSAAAREDETGQLPDLVGNGLQSAQDTAQAAGFFRLTSHDSLGRGRNQVLDREWKVCFQTPRPGRQTTETEVDFGAVKLDETCPKEDRKEPIRAGAKMPDFTGKSVKVARAALDRSTSVEVTDASADDRMVLVESNWKVCGQVPAAATELTGQPVSLTAVKFEESCP